MKNIELLHQAMQTEDKNRSNPTNQEIRELIKHCNWRVFKECPEIKKATNTVLKKRPLINAENTYRFTEWASTHYFYTSPEGWRADFDTSDEPNCITTAQLFKIWEFLKYRKILNKNKI